MAFFNLIKIHTQVPEDLDRDALPFSDHAEQQMLGADVVMTKAECFLTAQPDHILHSV